ncbi:MAG: hypothetical protein DRI24_17990 [Deltaproteobacteria bacterium]|nr:MAG: hypothetical protein DRI24_17990 [Deltaproteobacteria bacterium]
MKELNAEQQIYFDHMTRYGTPFELMERRDQLRKDLTTGTRMGINRKVATQALSKLQDMVNPATDGIDDIRHLNEGCIATAQVQRDAGYDYLAERILKPVGLSLYDLAPRKQDDNRDKRETAARDEYETSRIESIAKLRKQRSISQKEATAVFTGEDRSEYSKHPGDTMDEALRKQVNLNHTFKADRPM